jgi:ParB-like chromosome segregation protein Spo0J
MDNFSDITKHPVSSVVWIDSKLVTANDYNPNKVAPPEMKLLELSIQSDGYTQPIVTWLREDGMYEVIDGFHRHLVGKKLGLDKLPIVIVNKDREDKCDRISSTIRHNRARGKHVVQAMSDIVIELKNRNWKNERIARELGMEEDEVLRLCQITGLSGLFKDDEFSKSWDIKDSSPDDVFVPLDDLVDEEEKEKYGFRTVNTSDENRIFHTYDKWECHKAGLYNNTHPTLSKSECENEYMNFLSNEEAFRNALNSVITEWKCSCEHYLTNASMNRIAWLGQASLCYATGIPSTFRAGFHLLSDEQQKKANEIACEYLNKWLVANGMKEVTVEEAMTDRQSTIY